MFFTSCNDKQSTAPVSHVTELEGTWSGYNTNVIDTQWTYRMKNDSMIISADSLVIRRGTFTVDTTKDPKTIDMHIGWSSKTQEIGTTYYGSYLVSFNIMYISANAPGTARPGVLDGSVPQLQLTVVPPQQ
jgi:hypothetical protein